MLEKSIVIPNYLTHFYREGQRPFQSICDMEVEEAEKILRRDTDWRGDGTYLSSRREHEKILRERFIQAGGKPIRRNPIYMILGESPKGVHDMNQDYQKKITLPIDIFHSSIVSFTYPDSMYRIQENKLDEVFLQRNNDPKIYLTHELQHVSDKFEVYIHNNHYIEAQIWDDNPIKEFLGEKYSEM